MHVPKDHRPIVVTSTIMCVPLGATLGDCDIAGVACAKDESAIAATTAEDRWPQPSTRGTSSCCTAYRMISAVLFRPIFSRIRAR